MLPNILLNVRKSLEKASKINEKQIDILLNDMNSWKINQIIYPSRIKSLLLINYIKVYELLEIIKSLGILKYNYEVYCHKCEKFTDHSILSSINDFPDELYCDSGKHQLNPLEDVILIFKVIKIE